MDNQIPDQSFNAKLVVAGFAYVEPYDTMPMLLVQHLRALVHEIRSSNRGLWSGGSETIDSAVLIKSMIDVEALIMWPKLFRRLTTYFDKGYIRLGQLMRGFVTILSGEMTHFGCRMARKVICTALI